MKQQKADRRSQRTYHLVNSAFTELLLEKPYDEILVQDILDRAGIGHTTFYAHYFDKEDVLNSMTEQMLEMFAHQIAYSTTRQRVVPSLELFEHVYQSQQQQFRALMRGHAGEPLWEALQHVRRIFSSKKHYRPPWTHASFSGLAMIRMAWICCCSTSAIRTARVFSPARMSMAA